MKDTKTGETGYFAALFHNSKVNACIQMNTAGIVLCVNPAFKNYFGYEDEDINGRHLSVLFTDDDCAKKKPELEIEKVLKKGQAEDKNYLVRKDRRATWVSGESILVKHEDGTQSILKIIQDIHEQKDSEVSLLHANDFNQSILNAIDDFVILLDTSMQVINYNPAFERLFRNIDQYPVTDFAEFVKPYDKQQDLYNKILQVINTGQPFYKFVVEMIGSTGERVFDISCQRILLKEFNNVVLLVGHDITVQKRAEIEREDLMGFVAHELRNPLASILMSNDLMSSMVQQQRTEDLAMLLEKNKNYINRLNTMVAELYEAARVGGGNFLLSTAYFNFDEMVDEAVDMFRILHPGFKFDLQGKAVAQVLGDRYRIQQVVINYLSNAVKYADGNPDIIITVTSQANSVMVSVKDKGSGIAAEQMPYIFDRFFRAEKTSNLEGIGLGLYLCRRILHAHGGKVWAESQEGKGATFFFTLPISPEST